MPSLTKLNDDYPEIVVLDDAATPAADVWHTDVTFSENPPVTAILHMVKCPTVGGDTQWINLYRAYETLSAPMKDMLEGLTAIHVNRYGTGHVTEHPVVRVHPVTGRKSLYVNRIFTSHIRQLSRPESDTLCRSCIAGPSRATSRCDTAGKKATLVCGTTGATLHQRVNDGPVERTIQRITVLGDNPVGSREPTFDKHEPAANGASDFYGKSYPF